MSSVVLDASALMALLRSEPGSQAVREVLSDAAISTVNLSEVIAKATELTLEYERMKSSLLALRLRIVPFDEEQCELSAGLRPLTRTLGLSLGDRCCLALGLTLKTKIMTTDREWSKLPASFQVHVLR